MDHSHAVEHRIVEQYLLNELSPELRDEFEEHYFDCQDCAAELRATSAFLQVAREELRKPEVSTDRRTSFAPRPRTTFIQLIRWRPVFALGALAACLMVLIYQNTVTVPGLRSEVARLDTPVALPAISLVGDNSRGGELPSVSLHGARSLLLQFDIPTQGSFSSYSCSLYSPQHQLVWTVQVSAEEARNTISIRAPLDRSNVSGIYSLEVRGNQSQNGSSPASGVDFASYRFMLNAGATGEGR